jgi:Tol biopolymer transport system component/DNA-binding winged helix-turn-helix (wHTH) protein
MPEKMNGPAQNRVKFGPFTVDLHTHEVRKDGIRIRLIGQPFDILAVLLSKPGELVTREELRMRLWPGDTFVDFDHGLNAAVNKLRETLSDSAENPRFVETMPRRGYRFIAAVERPNVPGSPSVPVQPMPLANGSLRAETTPGATGSGQRRRGNFWLSPVAASVALLLVFVGAAVKIKNGGSHEARADTPLADATSLGMRIRPFTGVDQDAGQPAFSPDGKRIAFAREGMREEDSGIFVGTIGGDRQTQLTKSRHDRSPAWSPDGRRIVFSRWNENHCQIFIVPSEGGAEQRIDTGNVVSRRDELDWSPDGKAVAFNGSDAIHLVNLQTSAIRPLTNPPPTAEDRAPSFSADGKRVMFVRSRGSGFPEEIKTISAEGGEEILLTSVAAEVVGTPRWSADGKSVIFSSNFGGKPGLWRVSSEKREPPIQINDTGAEPAISPQSSLLAYDRGSHGLNIWQLELSATGHAQASILVPLTGQTEQGPGPQFSPDGKKLAFMSDRSGTMEIWVSDRDGKNVAQLTAIGNAGTPRWSPDSKSIVFDANRKGGAGIYTVALEGGVAPRLLTPDDTDNRCPSWSHDGKWIYFASRRTGRYEVWKIPAEGGVPVQLTRKGGHAALESRDGKRIFYAKSAFAYPEIWQVPVNGGEEKILSKELRPPFWATWSVVDEGPNRGIVFAQPSGSGAPVVSVFDLATRRVKTVGHLGIAPFWLSASRDGKVVVYDQPGWQQSQIMLVENFR